VSAGMTLDELMVLRGAAKNVTVSEQIKAYILAVVGATRNDPQLVKLGASPRASIALYKAAQAMALINARSFVTPDDVKSTAVSVLSHRLILASGQQQFGSAEQLVEKILNDIPVPV